MNFIGTHIYMERNCCVVQLTNLGLIVEMSSLETS